MQEIQANKLKHMEELGDDDDLEEEVVEDSDDDEVEEMFVKSQKANDIVCIFYPYNDQKFWVSLSGDDSGYLYQISLDDSSCNYEPYASQKVVSVPPINDKDVPLCSIIYRFVVL